MSAHVPSVATFAAYTLLGNQLHVASALTALSLFDVLRFPLFMLPQVVNDLVEAGVSFDRVRAFLLADEHVPVPGGDIPDAGVRIHRATFVHDGKKPPFAVPRNVKRDSPEEAYLRQLHDKDWEIRLLRARLDDACQAKEGKI